MRNVQKWCALLVILMTVAALAASPDETAGLAASQSWLKGVDAGHYAESWAQTASTFRSQVDQATWNKQLQGVRAPLGNVVSRKLLASKFATSLPGAPDGKYVVAQFNTSFEHKQSAVETVTSTLDKDGQWHVAGYFIR